MPGLKRIFGDDRGDSSVYSDGKDFSDDQIRQAVGLSKLVDKGIIGSSTGLKVATGAARGGLAPAMPQWMSNLLHKIGWYDDEFMG